MLFDIPLGSITAEDILSLEREEVPEDKHLEYKRSYEDNQHGKDEFRKDVTAFANSSGGYILIGIKEKPLMFDGREVAGVKIGEVVGITGSQADKERNRLHDLLKDFIRPRVPGVDIRCIDIPERNPILIVRIPRSFNSPHQITVKEKNPIGDLEFWVRQGSSSVRMDVDELRNAFLMSETQAERIRSFRMERLGKILAEDTFLPMEAGAKVVLHLVPQNAFGLGSRYDINTIAESLDALRLWGVNRRPNFDGIVAWSEDRNVGYTPAEKYIQVFRNGVLEIVTTDYFGVFGAQPRLNSKDLIYDMVEHLPKALNVQKELGVQSPVFLMLSLINVKEYGLTHTNVFQPLERAVLQLPEEICETFDVDAKAVLRPSFDMIWNAAGYEQCNFYDAAGNLHDPTRPRLR